MGAENDYAVSLELEDFEPFRNVDFLNIAGITSEVLFEEDHIDLQNEDTLDIGMVKNENYLNEEINTETLSVLRAPLGQPAPGNHPGEYNFHVSITSQDTKKSYIYSHLLNRIYLNMLKTFPIQFSWNYKETRGPLYVRATTVFAADDQNEKRVERCLQHRHCPNSNTDGFENIKMHVLRSARPYGSDDLFYCGDEDNPMSWFSVVIRFPTRPADGNDEFTHPYVFVCKTSCNSGINRRPINIVFTLEDESGNVLGRQTVGVKVCSCPKRDINKDEEDERPLKRRGKRKVTASQQQSVEPTQIPRLDHDVYQLQIVGKNNAQHLISVINKMMKGEAAEAPLEETRAKYYEVIKRNLSILGEH